MFFCFGYWLCAATTIHKRKSYRVEVVKWQTCRSLTKINQLKISSNRRKIALYKEIEVKESYAYVALHFYQTHKNSRFVHL